MKIKAVVLFAVMLGFLGSVGCQSVEEKKFEQNRERLRRMMLFKKVDTSRSDAISLGEFRAAMSDRAQKDVDLLFMRFDHDGSGMITLNEWLAVK
jgi:Ca2+-binding EF-hand superfamily protein